MSYASVFRKDLFAGKAFAAGYAHDVRNPNFRPALSLHAYSPRLTTMTRFRFLGGGRRLLIGQGDRRRGGLRRRLNRVGKSRNG